MYAIFTSTLQYGETDEYWAISSSGTGNYVSDQKLNIRCVRKQNLIKKSKFVRVNSKNIVIDTTNNLMWQDNKEIKNKTMDWQGAIKHCEDLDLLGFDNWVLPNKNELFTLMNYEKSRPTSNAPFKYYGRIASFWTSSSWRTPSQYTPDEAYLGQFYWGYLDVRRKDSIHYSRCIRVLKKDEIKDWLDTDNDGIVNSEDLDDDGDGISDVDEKKYGFDPLDKNDATEDADRDGISNIDEIKAGTNPTDKNDYPQTVKKTTMLSPKKSSTLNSTTVTFKWKNTKASKYYLKIGTKKGAKNLYDASQGKRTSRQVKNLPSNGQKIYVRLYTRIGKKWKYNDYVYNAHKAKTNYGKHDFNKDGVADILWKKGTTYSLWYMTKSGKHKYKNIGKKSTKYKVVDVADFNRDGVADILWKKGTTYSLWYMTKSGKHKYKNIGKKSTKYKVVDVADFNRDGVADILWKKGTTYSLWYMTKSGKHKYKNIGKKSTSYSVLPTINKDPKFGFKIKSSVKMEQWKYYLLNVKKGQTVSILLTNLSNDIDLYARLISKPTLKKFDISSVNYETISEKITMKIKKDTKMYIGIYGYIYGGKYSLEVK